MSGIICAKPRSSNICYSLKNSFNSSVYLHKVHGIRGGFLIAEFEQFDVRIDRSKSNDKDFFSKKNGSYPEHYVSDSKKVICNFIDNILDGDFRIFYPSGKLNRQNL